MSDIIQLLPDAIANQIAAGEVVQRPSSVVKELLENSVDAGSNSIQVIVKDAGKSLIQIVDDGKGMSPTDARMSFERHATSKIRKADDLFTLRTMGFRGEALASIAAVAQVEMKTKREEDELGTQIIIDGSEVKDQSPVACKRGTSISVKNLFFNVPARRNFLKSNPVELKHIIEDFQRVALAYPEISFSLFQNDVEVFNLPAGKLSHRIIGLFGKNYKEQLASCKEETAHLNIYGYLGKPEFSKKTRGDQFFFVNRRFIKNNYLNHAVMNAFEGLLSDDSYPFYVLFLEIDPKHIDVNVHPTKTEIKFDDERTVYGLIRAAVKQALGVHNFIPAIDFESDVNFPAFNYVKQERSGNFVENKNYEQFKNSTRQANLENWEKMYNELPGDSHFDFSSLRNAPETESKEITFESAANTINSNSLKNDLKKEVEESVFQIHNRYILTQVKSGVLYIDQQAAHERILFEKFLNNLEKRPGGSQQFLFPQTIELSPMDFALVIEISQEIRALGFEFSEFGKNTLVINGIPADLGGLNEKDLFEGLLEQFKRNKQELSISKKENVARAMARRAAIKTGHRLSIPEMKSLIDQLFACSNPNYAPNGQKTYFILELEKIGNYFN
jgi:DNA mismatch repair protein MutL